MRWFGAIRAALVATVILFPIRATAENEIGCQVYGNLSSVVVETKAFLDFLGSGGNAQSAWILEKRLKNRSSASLASSLKHLKLPKLATATETLITQQKSLLRTFRNTGRGSAAQNAMAIQARSQLNAVISLLGTVPCVSASDKSVAGFGVSSMAKSVAESSAFRLIASMFLVGGIAVGMFGWFSQIGKRRTKRYSCLVPCTVSSKDEVHPAMITNISRSGAKLNIDEGFERGDRVEINFIGESANCRVIRHKNGQLAIDFATLLHSDVLEKVINGLSASNVSRATVTSTVCS